MLSDLGGVQLVDEIEPAGVEDLVDESFDDCLVSFGVLVGGWHQVFLGAYMTTATAAGAKKAMDSQSSWE